MLFISNNKNTLWLFSYDLYQHKLYKSIYIYIYIQPFLYIKCSTLSPNIKSVNLQFFMSPCWKCLSTIVEIIMNTVTRKQLLLFKCQCSSRIAHTGVVHIHTLAGLSILQKLQVHSLSISISPLKTTSSLKISINIILIYYFLEHIRNTVGSRLSKLIGTDRGSDIQYLEYVILILYCTNL